MEHTTPTTHGSVIDVLLVEAPDCHYCEHARRLIDDLAEHFGLRLGVVEMASEMGRDLVATHRIPFPPLLLINGEYFGHGRISKRKLERHLTALVGNA